MNPPTTGPSPRTTYRARVLIDAASVMLDAEVYASAPLEMTARVTVPDRGTYYGRGNNGLCAVSDAARQVGAVLEVLLPDQKSREELQEMLDRAMRACAQCIPKELIDCTKCGAHHYDGENGEEFATRPHHNHQCSACGEIFPWGHYSFGVRPCGEEGCIRPKGHKGAHETAKLPRVVVTVPTGLEKQYRDTMEFIGEDGQVHHVVSPTYRAALPEEAATHYPAVKNGEGGMGFVLDESSAIHEGW